MSVLKIKKGVNSDKSFENIHTDSNFHYCHSYRFLVCIEGSDRIITHIADDNISIKLQKYDILGFDYANTLHYIENRNEVNDTRDGTRILLKLQYAKSDLCYALTKNYTKMSRQLFEENKKNMGIYGKLMIIAQFLSAHIVYFLLFSYLFLLLYFNLSEGDSRKKIVEFYLIFMFLFALIHIILQVYVLSFSSGVKRCQS